MLSDSRYKAVLLACLIAGTSIGALASKECPYQEIKDAEGRMVHGWVLVNDDVQQREYLVPEVPGALVYMPHPVPEHDGQQIPIPQNRRVAVNGGSTMYLVVIPESGQLLGDDTPGPVVMIEAAGSIPRGGHELEIISTEHDMQVASLREQFRRTLGTGEPKTLSDLRDTLIVDGDEEADPLKDPGIAAALTKRIAVTTNIDLLQQFGDAFVGTEVGTAAMTRRATLVREQKRQQEQSKKEQQEKLRQQKLRVDELDKKHEELEKRLQQLKEANKVEQQLAEQQRAFMERQVSMCTKQIAEVQLQAQHAIEGIEKLCRQVVADSVAELGKLAARWHEAQGPAREAERQTEELRKQLTELNELRQREQAEYRRLYQPGSGSPQQLPARAPSATVGTPRSEVFVYGSIGSELERPTTGESTNGPRTTTPSPIPAAPAVLDPLMPERVVPSPTNNGSPDHAAELPADPNGERPGAVKFIQIGFNSLLAKVSPGVSATASLK